ncbi:AraC family transcriptional regulator ligand-binding domain-containing protein [Mycobacterium syngnathidarum]
MTEFCHPLGARLLLLAASTLGIDYQRCIEGTAINPKTITDSAEPVLLADEIRMTRNLQAAFGTSVGLGAIIGKQINAANVGVWGFSMVTSATLRAALDVPARMSRVSPIINRVELVAEADTFYVIFHDHRSPQDLRQLILERDLTAFGSFLDQMCGQTVVTRIEVQPRYGSANLRRVFPSTSIIEGMSRTALHIDPAALDCRLPLAHAATHAACLRQLEAELEVVRESASLTHRVSSRLRANLSCMPTLKELSAEMSMDCRTVRRRLAAESTSYRQIACEVRADVARELLENNHSVASVADHLGYADTVAFTHAFKRWTGVSPGSYRLKEREAV